MLRDTFMIYITGSVWQNDCSRRPGTQEVHTTAFLEDLPKLIKRYEAREGQCSSFDIRVVK